MGYSLSKKKFATDIRPLNQDDYNKGILQLFKQLNGAEINLSFQEFRNRMLLMERQFSYVYVYEKDDIIICTGKLLQEHKFYSNVAHIEDIIVDEKYRGLGLGKNMVKFLTAKAFKDNCYKVILECNDNIRPFYEKLDFKVKGNQMVFYKNN